MYIYMNSNAMSSNPSPVKPLRKRILSEGPGAVAVVSQFLPKSVTKPSS